MHIVLFHLYSQKPYPVYQEISAALRRRGHTVWVGARNGKGDLTWHDGQRELAVEPGPGRLVPAWARHIPVLAQILRRAAFFVFLWRVRAFLHRAKPDIVQVNTNLSAWVLPLMRPAKTQFVFDIRQINEAVSDKLLVKLKEQQLILTRKFYARYLFARTCFCHKEAAHKILGANWPQKGVVVPVGLDPRFLSLEVKQPLSSEDDQPVRFIYVGTLSKIRNLGKLLFAAQALLARTDRFQLDLVGPDTANGLYEQMAADLGVEDTVSIKPPIPYAEIPDLLATYEVGLAYVPDRPTWHYQPTIKVLEYRALGMPILSTDVASHRELVEDGVNGLLVQDSVEALTAGMMRFVMDRPFLQQCQEQAQAMRQGISWDGVAEMYETKVYQPLSLGAAKKAKSFT